MCRAPSDILTWQAGRPRLSPEPGVAKVWRICEPEAGSLQQGRHRGVDVEGEIDIFSAPRLGEQLIDLASKNSYQLVINLDKVGFLDSTDLGVLAGGLKRVRAHDGSLDLVCAQEWRLKIFKITGLTKVFGIHETVDQAIAAKKGEQ